MINQATRLQDAQDLTPNPYHRWDFHDDVLLGGLTDYIAHDIRRGRNSTVSLLYRITIRDTLGR
jgi:hypothetical protein